MKIKSVQHNFIMKSMMTAANVIVPLIIYPYICRILNPAGVGAVSFAQSIIYYFQIFALLGVPTYGIRACARVRDDKEELSRTVHEILFINLITGIISYAALFICMAVVPQIRNEKALFLVASLSIICSIISCEWLYSGLEKYDFMAIASLSFKILMIIATFLFIKNENDYVIYAGVYVLGTTGWGIVTFLNLKKVIYIKNLGSYDFKRHLKPVGIFFAMAIATTIYTQMDSVMIGFIKGTIENGYYDAAVKAKMAVVSCLSSLGAVLLPRSAYYLEKGEKDEFLSISSKALKLISIASVSICVCLVLLAEPIIMLLSGKQFVNSIIPMKIIMPSIIFIGITNITGIQMMIPLGREKQVLYSEIVGAVINLIVNALLIPKLGASGAAIGTVAAEFAVFIVQIISIRDVLPLLKKAKTQETEKSDGSNN